MKVLLGLFLFLSFFSFTKAQQTNLKKYIGKYPNEMFKREPQLKARLRKLLGRNYTNFINNLTVQGEIGYDDGYLFMSGCAPHYCGGREAVLVIDPTGKFLFAGLLMENYKKKFKLFGTKSDFQPAAFVRIINEREREIP